MIPRQHLRLVASLLCVLTLAAGAPLAQGRGAPPQEPGTRQEPATPPVTPPATPPPAQPDANADANVDADADDDADDDASGKTFRLGEIVYVLGQEPGGPGIGGAVIARDQLQLFERTSLDRAVNLIPGVVSTFDANGRRNESDVFVRGFGRQQVPLMVDGVRIYLPADNRLDFGRFLTADVAAIQIQKGYASVLDGPGAMGGAINLVTLTPTKAFQAEGGLSTGGRGIEGWNAYAIVGSRRPRYYVQSSVALSDRESWSLSGTYQPAAGSLQPSGKRLGSETQDWRANVKVGFTPNPSDEYTVNYTRQSGEKSAPLNIYNNPPVPPNSFWRWPWWDVQNTSVLTTTQLGASSYVKGKAYFNTFSNGLDAFDDLTYTTQSANGRFHSPYNDHASGVSVEFGTTPVAANTFKASVHYRNDVHTEQQTSRPTHPTLRTQEPEQEQSQYTWSVAVEDTLRVRPTVDLVGGISYEAYGILKAEEFSAARGLFEYPTGGSDAVNWQGGVVWRHTTGEWHGSVSDRARFPVIFELYSTRFGFATPNPDLGAERATNLELGWSRALAGGMRASAAVFYSDVGNLIQTVVLPDTTTQTQNVGDGEFSGVELSLESAVSDTVRAGGNYTYMHRIVRDALQPNLRPTGVPAHRAFLYATWQPSQRLRITPSLELAGERWSEVNPAPAFPYLQVGAYGLLDLDATYALPRSLDLSVGFKNLLDDYYELAWGYPQQGRTVYVKMRKAF
jgi:iron complex outermembrane receptor protein